jgi:hypothetical protein
VVDPIAVTLQCPGCGAKISISESMSLFACRYCGATVKVQRTESVIALDLVADAVNRVQQGTDRTAAELAIRRLSEQLAKSEATLVELIEERQRLLDSWNMHIRAFSRPKPGHEPGVAFGVGFSVFMLLLIVLGSATTTKNMGLFWAGVAVALAAGITAAWYWGWRDKESRIHLGLRAQDDRDAAVKKQDAEIGQAKGQVATLKQRLDRNLQIADR